MKMEKELKEMLEQAGTKDACSSALRQLSKCKSLEEALEHKRAPAWCYWYADCVLKGPFELGEKAIAREACYSYLYADNILKGRFKLGEKAIAKSAFYSHQYALHKTKTDNQKEKEK